MASFRVHYGFFNAIEIEIELRKKNWMAYLFFMPKVTEGQLAVEIFF